MIHLDKSPSKTVVITCDECPHWAAIRFGMHEAHAAACHHETTLHPGEQTARQTARKWAAREVRHAVDSQNV